MGCSQTKDTERSEPAAGPEDRVSGKYRLGEVLGQGGFAEVREGIHLESGTRFAIKCTSRANMCDVDEAAVRTEVNIMQTLEHRHIVKYYDFYETPEFFYVVMEHLEGGELFDRLVQKTFYSEREACTVIRTLCKTLQYCHDKSVIHRDLKPENLLLESPDDDTSIKIIDFGFAATGNSMETQLGTPTYIAPEIIRGETYGPGVDMWAVGVISFLLLAGYPPFQDNNQRILFRKIKKGEFEFHDKYWSEVSAEAKDFVSKLLVCDPLARFSAADAVGHSWLRRDDTELMQRELTGTLEQLKHYHGIRKFRAAVDVVIAVNRLKSLCDSNGHDAATAVEASQKESQKAADARQPLPDVGGKEGNVTGISVLVEADVEVEVHSAAN